MESKPSLFNDYPDTQWIVIAAVGLSLIFQALFYIYFFCSFKRNYTRNLTLKSYRKQKFSVRQPNNSFSYGEDYDAEGGEVSSEEPDTSPPRTKSLAIRADSVRTPGRPVVVAAQSHNEVNQKRKKSQVEVVGKDPEFVDELKTKVTSRSGAKSGRIKSSKSNQEIKVEDLDTSENDLENVPGAVKSISRDKEPEIKILNEKRENAGKKNGVRRVKLRPKVTHAHNEDKDRKTTPEIELYEVYFDKNGENALNTKTKTSIQKIKFKRRSPSLGSN